MALVGLRRSLASYNGNSEPLDVLARDPNEWRQWQEYRPKTNQFNRKFIFSLARVYYESDSWLFGGVFRVTKRLPDRYQVELTDQGASFVGRLKLGLRHRSRARRVNMEGRLDEFMVLEVLREPYSGRPFSSFESIDLSFREFEVLHRNNRPDWRAALESVSGVYLITVRTPNVVRLYVGAAYGEQGIWSRWVEYPKTGHGVNAELRKLMGAADLAIVACTSVFPCSNTCPVIRWTGWLTTAKGTGREFSEPAVQKGSTGSSART